MEKERVENFTMQIDKMGRMSVPKHIRTRLGIVGKAAEVNITIRVNKVFEIEEEKNE